MKTQLHYYDIFPKVIKEGLEATICIKPLGAHSEFKKAEYQIQILPLCERSWPLSTLPSKVHSMQVTPDADGCIRIIHTFSGEQEYYIRFSENGKCILQLSVYSVKKDLTDRYPYMGDLHVHSFRSDGKEEPAIVAANLRSSGYDFFAITDHRRYYPSLEAIAAYSGVKIDMNILPGEEVHLPGNDVHIVNFGGEYSINGMLESSAQILEKGPAEEFRSFHSSICPDVINDEEFHRQVNEILATLQLPADVDGFTYAACMWTFDQIRRANGLGIFAHPYWINDVFHVNERTTDYLFETHIFDAFELLGGERALDQNEFQVAHYNDARSKGWNFPIVGSSDSHGTVNNPNTYIAKTIVFAPANERKAIISSIKNFYSVAVDCISPEYRLAGEFRFIKYARFLMDNYFPLHDELCFEEGRLMKNHVCGDTQAAPMLKGLNGRTHKLLERYFYFG